MGWYGENFNGLNAKYQVGSVSYREEISGDPLDAININTSTIATITVEEIGGAITDYSCAVYLFRVPNSEDEYIGTTTDLLENFLFKSEIISNPDTSSPNVTTSLVSGDLVIEYTVGFSTAEKLRLTTDDEFILLVQVEDPTIAAGNSDRIMLLADFRNYVDVDFLAEFIDVSTYGFLVHPQILGNSNPAGSSVVSNEDGILLEAVFGANTTRNVVINSIYVSLLAYNSVLNTSFELDRYDFNIGDTPVFSGGAQQLAIESTRGYPLPAGDQFNLVRIVTGNQNGNYREYDLVIGQKIKWQDWIFNPGADSVFFDASQPNNNLNEKSSNYSDEEGYSIRLALVVNVTGEDDLGRILTGDFVNYGGVLTVNDYDESEDGVSGVIQTFDLETGNSLEGNILYNGKDTLFKAVFQDAGAMTYGVHRIEPSQNQGDGILELSSILPSVTNNLLKPLQGETQLKFTLVGSELTTECLIDGELIQEGIQYKLSARTGLEPIVLSFFTEWDTRNTSLDSSASNQVKLPLVPSGNYNFIVDWGDGNQDVITQWDQAETTHTYAVEGVKTIQIGGTVEGWAFEATGDRLKILDITQWGDFAFAAFVGSQFEGCENLSITAVDVPNTDNLNTVTSMFKNCVSLTDVSNINSWDVSSILNANETFLNTQFNGDVSSWQVGNCTAFIGTFENSPFNGSLNSWDMSSAISISRMFRNNTAFNQPVNWSFSSSLNDISETFNGATAFNQTVSGWAIDTVTLAIGTFQDTPAFNQNLDAWSNRVANIVSAIGMFRRSGQNSSMLNWDLASCLNVQGMFRESSFDHPSINTWNVSSVVNFTGMFQLSTFNQSLNSWQITSATTLASMFQDNTVFNGDIDGWGASFGNVQNMSLMLEGCTSFNKPVNSWDVSSVTNMFGVFSASGFNQPVDNWDVSSVTSFFATFQQCPFNQSLSSWITSSAQNMQQMFNGNSAFNQSLSNFDMTGVSNCTRMLENAGLSTVNYDSTLGGWGSQVLVNGVVIGVDGLTYTSGGPGDLARTNIISTYAWTFIGDSPV